MYSLREQIEKGQLLMWVDFQLGTVPGTCFKGRQTWS